MLSALLLVASLAQATPSSGPVPAATMPPEWRICRYIGNGWRGMNMPPTASPPPSTDIVHAVAITALVDGSKWYVGWLVFRRDGRAWYLDGPVSAPFPPRAASTGVRKALGLSKFGTDHLGEGDIFKLNEVAFANVINAGFGVTSCY